MTTAPFRLFVRGTWIDTNVEHAASFSLNHIGAALGLPRLLWSAAGEVVVGQHETGRPEQVAKWAEALRQNPTRLVERSGRHAIEISGG